MIEHPARANFDASDSRVFLVTCAAGTATGRSRDPARHPPLVPSGRRALRLTKLRTRHTRSSVSPQTPKELGDLRDEFGHIVCARRSPPCRRRRIISSVADAGRQHRIYGAGISVSDRRRPAQLRTRICSCGLALPSPCACLDSTRSIGTRTSRPWRTPRSAITWSAKCRTLPAPPFNTLISMQLS